MGRVRRRGRYPCFLAQAMRTLRSARIVTPLFAVSFRLTKVSDVRPAAWTVSVTSIEPSALYLAKYLLRFARAYSLAQTCSTPVSIRSTRCERGSSSKSGLSSASCPSAESERVVSDCSEPSPPDPQSPCKAPASRLSLRLVACYSAWFDPRCAHRSTSGFVQLRANREAALETIMETTQPLTKTGTSDVTVR
jgi:hypothetical protein